MRPVKVAFVAAGDRGDPEAYLRLAQSYVSGLSFQGDKFECQIFTEIPPALEFLSAATGNTRTLVLLSAQLGQQADQIAAQYPDLRVLVFTGGDLPVGKPQMLQKTWISLKTLPAILS